MRGRAENDEGLCAYPLSQSWSASSLSHSLPRLRWWRRRLQSRLSSWSSSRSGLAALA